MYEQIIYDLSGERMNKIGGCNMQSYCKKQISLSFVEISVISNVVNLTR